MQHLAIVTHANNQLIETKLNEVAGKVQNVLSVDLAQMQSVVVALGTLDVQTNLANASAKMGVMEQTMMGIQTQLSTHMGVVGIMGNNQNDIVNKIKEIETRKSGSGKHKLLTLGNLSPGTRSLGPLAPHGRRRPHP